MTDLAIFLTSALVALATGVIVLAVGVLAWRHQQWTQRARRRIGWYTR